MKKFLSTFFVSLIAVVFVAVAVVPVVAHAQQNPLDPGYLIVCGAKNPPNNHPCTVEDFFTLAKHFLNLLFFLTVPLTFFGCAYAGYLYMTAQDDSSKTSKAKGIFKGIIIGFLFICGAWLIVYTIVDPILNKDAYDTFKIKN